MQLNVAHYLDVVCFPFNGFKHKQIVPIKGIVL